ncbi:unnamed protein product, partial [Ilex paraguariensis]
MTPAVYDWFGSVWTQHFGTWSLLGSSFAALWVMLWWKHVKPDWMLFLLVQEDGVNLLTVIKGTGKYRRSRRHDFVMNFLPPSMSEFRGALERNGWLRFATSPVMFSTLEDGRLVRGLAGVPDEGPVLLVGYHMLLGCEVVPLVEEFLREKNVLVRGVAHPTLFTQMAETQSQEFSFFDLLKVFGAVPVTASNLFKLFSTKSHVLLYPGGVREAFHQKGEQYKLFWPDQPEFVRMAARFGATIVPFGAIGEDDVTEGKQIVAVIRETEGGNHCGGVVTGMIIEGRGSGRNDDSGVLLVAGGDVAAVMS